MIKFSYKAKLPDGSITVGSISAKDKTEATSLLSSQGKTALTLVEAKKSILNFNINISLLNKVKLTDKIVFTKDLAGMLKAGLSLYRALQVIEKQLSNKYFKKIIGSLIEEIDKGGTLSSGLAKFPDVFSTLFVSMTRAGEESGSLPKTLAEIGVNLEKSHNLSRKIKSALMYPSIIVSAIVLIAILMFIYVVPTLTKTFKELNIELPASTKFVIFLSDLISNHTLLLFLGIFVIIFGFWSLTKLKSTKKYIDLLIIKLPIIGGIAKEMNSARTTRTLSSLLASGVDISKAISITKDVLQNFHYKKVMDKVLVVVEKGEPISRVFQEENKLYPVMVGEMIEVGEETGKLGDMLLEIALFYEGEVEAKTKDLSTVVEPILMVLIGAAVGFFAVSMLTPMYSIMD